MAWLLLAAAIATEVVGTLALKASDGFTKVAPSVLVVVGYVASFVLFGRAMRDLPVGLSYAVWSGLGTAGAVLGGMALFRERLTWVQAIGILVVMAGVALLTSGEPAPHSIQ